MVKTGINNWAKEDRPRERLLHDGADKLKKSELLAILIGSGSKGESAVDLMQRILKDHDDNLNLVGRMSVNELMSYKGIGEAKAITILAACELGRRRQLGDAMSRPKIDCSSAVYDVIYPRVCDAATEEAWILLLNRAFKLIKCMRISQGGISSTTVDVRVMLREALLNNATVVALCHNHPSGQIRPSRADDQLTTSVAAACKAVDIYFLDHVIVGDGVYYSYRDEGKLY